MNLPASVQMSATATATTANGHNNDLVDDLDELDEDLPVSPSANTTTSHW